jgi:XRE family transcriptional regulator, thiamine biosynthesis regulator
MQPPCEVMVSDFLPNIRGIVSHELHDRGASQGRIATLLGITQARVSYYLSKKRSFFENELGTKFGLSQNDAANYAKILAEDVSRSQTDGIFTVYSIWKSLLFSGAVCGYHQTKSHVATDCTVCMELHKPQREALEPSDRESEDTFILRDIASAISLIEASPYFPSVMPEVSVNLAMSRLNPKTGRDVAAVPGRINKIHGRAKAFVPPEFGASNHMSKVLLLANSRNQELRAALNLKYDALVDRALQELDIPKKITPSESRRILRHGNIESMVGASKSGAVDDPVINRLGQTKMPQDFDQPVFAIVDRGSEGLEPMTYLFGKKATDVAQVATKIAQTCFNLQISKAA